MKYGYLLLGLISAFFISCGDHYRILMKLYLFIFRVTTEHSDKHIYYPVAESSKKYDYHYYIKNCEPWHLCNALLPYPLKDKNLSFTFYHIIISFSTVFDNNSWFVFSNIQLSFKKRFYFFKRDKIDKAGAYLTQKNKVQTLARAFFISPCRFYNILKGVFCFEGHIIFFQ